MGSYAPSFAHRFCLAGARSVSSDGYTIRSTKTPDGLGTTCVEFSSKLKASVPKEMLAKLRVSAYDITLEETSMEDAAKRFGGTIGSKGDAGDFLEWLCLRGTDAADHWVLWLESAK